MRRSCENENTKIRNSLTNVHERPRRVCPSMAVLACACGLFRPRVKWAQHPTVVAAVRPRSINKLMCIVTSAHDSTSPMLLAADDASPASKVLYESLLEAES